MPKVDLFWVETPGLTGLASEELAEGLGLALNKGGDVQAAVVTCREADADTALRMRLKGLSVKWLDLEAQVGAGSDEHKKARAASALAMAAARAAKGTLPPLYTDKPALNILVAGSGEAALRACKECLAMGHPVTLATAHDSIEACGRDDDPAVVKDLAAGLPDGLDVLYATDVLELTGAAGDFRAWLKGPGGKWEQRFGGVVLAPVSLTAPADNDLGFDDDFAVPLSGFSGLPEPAEDCAWRYVALAAGVERPLSAAAFNRAVKKALELQGEDGVQCLVLFNEARVATEGGERVFREARDAGVLFVRLAPGGLKVAEGGRKLSWPDPVLGEEVELIPDCLLLAEEAFALPPDFLANPVLWPPKEFLAPEGAPRLSGGRTARSGMYLAGAVNGAMAGEGRQVQAASLAGDLHARLSAWVNPIPAVNTELCAACLTCVRVCPHGAPRFVEDRIRAAAAACVGCGVCAAECPAEAITPPGLSNPEVMAGLEAGLKKAGQGAWLLFACEQSAMQAFAELSLKGHEWPQRLLVMPVPCAGRVGQQLIMKALSLGAAGVLVAGCHDGNCRSVSGNLRAALRTGETASLLASLGLTPESVSFINMASNQPDVLAREVARMDGLVREG